MQEINSIVMGVSCDDKCHRDNKVEGVRSARNWEFGLECEIILELRGKVAFGQRLKEVEKTSHMFFGSRVLQSSWTQA